MHRTCVPFAVDSRKYQLKEVSWWAVSYFLD